MSDLTLQSQIANRQSQMPVPLPQSNVMIRAGVMSDVPFIDSLQKLHAKQVGWMPTATLEGKIRLGHVPVAEEAGVGGQGSVKAATAFY